MIWELTKLIIWSHFLISIFFNRLTSFLLSADSYSFFFFIKLFSQCCYLNTLSYDIVYMKMFGCEFYDYYVIFIVYYFNWFFYLLYSLEGGILYFYLSVFFSVFEKSKFSTSSLFYPSLALAWCYYFQGIAGMISILGLLSLFLG